MPQVSLDEILEAIGEKPAEAKPVSLDEILAGAGIEKEELEGASLFGETGKDTATAAPASTTKAVPFAAEPSKIQRFVQTAAKQVAQIPEMGRAAFPGAFPEGAVGTAQATIAGLGAAPFAYLEQGLETLRAGAEESGRKIAESDLPVLETLKQTPVMAANIVRAVLPGLSSALENSVSGEAYESPEKAAETVVGALFDFPIVAGIKAKLAPKGVELPDVPFVEKLGDERSVVDRQKFVEEVKVELDHIDKMTRLEASEELLGLAKERRLDEKESGKAIAALSEKEVKEHLRRHSTEKIAVKVLFGEEKAAAEFPISGKKVVEMVRKNEGEAAAQLVEGLHRLGIETLETHGGKGEPIVVRLAEAPPEIATRSIEDIIAEGGGAEEPSHYRTDESLVRAIEPGFGTTDLSVDLTGLTEKQGVAKVRAALKEIKERLEFPQSFAPETFKTPAEMSLPEFVQEQAPAGLPYDELKLQHRMKVEDELIQGKQVKGAEDYAELGEAEVKEPPARPEPVPAAEVFNLEVQNIATDVDRFQNRLSEYSEKTVQAIRENFDPNALDPIIVWKDPADGQSYVLSGHSRLEGMKQRGEAAIPARYFRGTAEEAHRFATQEANRLASQETLPETIRAYREAKKVQTQSKLRDLFGSDVGWLDAVQNLDSKGQFLDLLSQPPSALESFPYIKRFARWVGELRSRYADKLTNLHEQQLFDFLYKTERKNMDISKDNFYYLVEKQLDRLDFDPEQPLVLKRTGEVMSGTKARADTGEAEVEITRLKALQEEARTVAEHDALQREIDRVQSSIDQMVKDQVSLFGENPADFKPRFGEANTVFTKEKFEAALKKSVAERPRLGPLDPDLFMSLVDIGGYYIEGGLREFGTWSKEMAKTLGEKFRSLPATEIKKIYEAAIVKVDDRAAAMGRAVNEASLKIEFLTGQLDEMSRGAKMFLEEQSTFAQTGNIPKEQRAAFKEEIGTPSQFDTYRYGISQDKVTKTVEALLGTIGEVRKIEEMVKEQGDPISANILTGNTAALESLIPSLEKLLETYNLEQFAGGRILNIWKDPVLRQQLLYVQQTYEGIGHNLKGLRYIKEKLPILDNVLYSAKNWAKLTDGERQALYNDLVNAWRFNLFSVTSFWFDFVTNAAELMAQFDANVGRDIGYIIQKGMHDYLGKEYTAGEVGSFQIPSIRAFGSTLYEHTLAPVLEGKPFKSELPVVVEKGLGGKTFFGEHLSDRIYSKGKKQTVVTGPYAKVYGMTGELAEWYLGVTVHAKSAVDIAAKRLAAESVIRRYATMETDRRVFETKIEREAFRKAAMENPPQEIIDAAIREGNKAGFNRPLTKFETRLANSIGVKLFAAPFARWSFQYSRWAAEMLGYNREVWSMTGPIGKNLPEISAYLTKSASGWGGLYLLYQMFLAPDAPRDGDVDFETMQYISKTKDLKTRLSNLEPVTTGTILAAMIFGTPEQRKEAWNGIKFSSLGGAQVFQQGGLLSELARFFGGLQQDRQLSYSEKRSFDRFLITLIPGQALLRALEATLDETVREGIGAALPGVSFASPEAISMTTGESIRPKQKIPGLGVRFRTIAGVPIPGMELEVEPVEALLRYADVPIYKGFPFAVGGYPSLADAPDEIVREWRKAVGRERQEIFQKFLKEKGGMAELAITDPEKVKRWVQAKDALAVRRASLEVNRKHGTRRRKRYEVRQRGPYLRREAVPAEAR